jgi:hypothetical protein
MQAFETTGQIDNTGFLHLDQPLLIRNKRAKIVVLLDEPTDTTDWLQAMSTNPAFAFLKDAEEDIYTTQDGTPVS